MVWFAVYSVYSLLLDLPATLPKLYCCYICHRAINSFNLNKDSTKVQILTAFLFHSIHHVALRITLTSITCLPLQGLPTVNSVCPLGFNIGIPPSLATIHKIDFLTALLWNYPMVCYLYHFRDGWFVVILSHRYIRFKVSGLKSSYYKPFFTLFVLNVYHNIIYKLNYAFLLYIHFIYLSNMSKNSLKELTFILIIQNYLSFVSKCKGNTNFWIDQIICVKKP